MFTVQLCAAAFKHLFQQHCQSPESLSFLLTTMYCISYIRLTHPPQAVSSTTPSAKPPRVTSRFGARTIPSSSRRPINNTIMSVYRPWSLATWRRRTTRGRLRSIWWNHCRCVIVRRSREDWFCWWSSWRQLRRLLVRDKRGGMDYGRVVKGLDYDAVRKLKFKLFS